ncbi:MAG: methylenetetrahydrofolate--tRNA-(uracil(54)-C(5))-methyltransferase (FADH(2)-oxidizing) TrmFO [Deltaproteobacteria bacterium]|jgi:methylenetetrahydrofolate--tRNA-(uracil-5-)-methyltransferase|nr:methylenetetrahydrofolate--tRNA-(uracil(54)-C(5))-methyltransferase (FADH(2)-oxidizing) TrmFO [Deltaproteobacteria bacterium]
MSIHSLAVVGGGLAGCECALVLARSGLSVTVYEQKPHRLSPAHTGPLLAELVCSNSLRSDEPQSAVGLLKQEMRDLGSFFLRAADATRVPAGKALAVDREAFAATMTRTVENEPRITLIRQPVDSLDDPRLDAFDRIVVAAGPLAGEALTADLTRLLGEDQLYFYDAIAPIVSGESVDQRVAFRGSRYHEPGDGDYLNCPMTKEAYQAFHQALLAADKVAPRAFERERHFEGCMPIETLAERGERTLAFGPLKPVGFIDPRTGCRPYALLQLRPENLNRSMFNLVGCQTKLTYPAQEAVFRLVPGLERAIFVRHGSMHRNTYVNAPKALDARLALAGHPRIHLAGQITGVEGYVESAACGLWLGLSLAAEARGAALAPPPPTTAMGALLAHLRTPAKFFQPSNVNFGLMPEPEGRLRKHARKLAYAERAKTDFAAWMRTNALAIGSLIP